MHTRYSRWAWLRLAMGHWVVLGTLKAPHNIKHQTQHQLSLMPRLEEQGVYIDWHHTHPSRLLLGLFCKLGLFYSKVTLYPPLSFSNAFSVKYGRNKRKDISRCWFKVTQFVQGVKLSGGKTNKTCTLVA